jgi:ADP-ribose pyrophosphatase YjhB (NUDIX family)
MHAQGHAFQTDLVVGVDLHPQARALAEAAARQLDAPEAQRRLAGVQGLHFLAVTIFDRPDLDPLLVIEAHGDGARRHLAAALASAVGQELLELAAYAKPHRPDALPPSTSGALVRWMLGHRMRTMARHQGHRALSAARIREDAVLAGEARSLWERGGWPSAAPGETAEQALHRNARERLGAPAPRRRRSLYPAGDHGFDLLTTGALTLALVALAYTGLLAGLRLARSILGVLDLAWARAAAAWLDANAPHATAHGWWALAALGVLAALVRALWRHLRRIEHSESEAAIPATTPEREARLLARETAATHPTRQNHFASLVAIKPGTTRWLLLNAKHFFLRMRLIHHGAMGHLGEMRTVHFGGWYLAPGGGGLIFLSNYDGHFAAYLDDFIEKAAEGLTLAWNDAVGFPRTRGLLNEGAAKGRQFKPFARRSQAATLAWYRAYPDVTVNSVWRNAELVGGLRRERLGAREAAAWGRAL